MFGFVVIGILAVGMFVVLLGFFTRRLMLWVGCVAVFASVCNAALWLSFAAFLEATLGLQIFDIVFKINVIRIKSIK
jgi:hypothetical protein